MPVTDPADDLVEYDDIEGVDNTDLTKEPAPMSSTQKK
jgi:hypothetical protein